MSKKYTMFVNENGFLSKNREFSIAGVIFEQEYCTNSENKECELASKINYYKERILGKNGVDVSIDDIVLEENDYKNITTDTRKEFIKHVPMIFKGVKVSIILSSIKQNNESNEDSYNKVIKNLLKNFYSFLIKNKATGGVVIESKNRKDSSIMQQKFFDIYNERRNNLIMTEGSEERINSFIIWEKSNKKYGFGIELANILNNILYRVSNGLTEFDKKIISYIEYGSENKIFNIIENKIYRDEITNESDKDLQENKEVMNAFVNQVRNLKEELEIKNTKIYNKEKEINKLTQEMQMLQQRLEEVMKNKKSDNLLLEIISDINLKMKGLEMRARAIKN